MDTTLFTIEELLSLNMGVIYGKFLHSMEKLFKEELQKVDPGLEKIKTSIVSMSGMFDLEKNNFERDFSSELEEITFWLPNHKSRLVICVAGVAGSSCPSIELYSDTDVLDYMVDDSPVNHLFSDEVIKSCVQWLVEGTLPGENPCRYVG